MTGVATPPWTCSAQAIAKPAEHDAAREQVQLQSVAAEGVQKTRPDVDADGVDEEDQPELADEVQDMVIDLGAEMREQQAGEQHAGGAETDAAHFELAEQDAGKGGQADPEGGSRRAGAEQQGLYHFHCLIPFKKDAGSSGRAQFQVRNPRLHCADEGFAGRP